MILSKYAVEVIKAVTDPYSGLPSKKKENGYSGMPDVADVREACDDEANRIARMQRYAQLPAPDFSRPRLAASQRVPGDLATIFVPASNPRYAALVKWSETADGRKFKFETRPGIWVAHDIWDQRTSVVGFARGAPDLRPLTLSEDARRAMADIDDQRAGNLPCDLAHPTDAYQGDALSAFDNTLKK